MTNYNKTASRVNRIAANLAWEIKYWADMLGCSEVEVMPAVKDLLGLSRTKKNAAATDRLKRQYKLA